MPDISDWCPGYGGNAHYGLLRSVSTSALQSLTYDYDAKGNVASLIDGRNSNETISFSYDHLDRLTSAASALFSESYAYNAIGTFQSKGGVSYGYPSGGSPRPHAPTAVGGNTYSYDNNGNLTAAEGRTYTYDAENRLTQVHEGGSQLRSFAYDGDGVLRSRADAGSTVMHYVTSDYQVNPSTGEATVFYRFGGRAVARRTNSGLLYVLADHLSSSQAEVQPNQAEAGQRRNYPFGTDRPVSGASDIIDDERYTSQKRMDAGNGNTKRELYYYGARWYLPGVGVFTQPDSIVPDPKNPQALNRFSYCVNNPVKYIDPTGHDYDDDYWGGIPVPGEYQVISEEAPGSESFDADYYGGIPVPGNVGASDAGYSSSQSLPLGQMTPQLAQFMMEQQGAAQGPYWDTLPYGPEYVCRDWANNGVLLNQPDIDDISSGLITAISVGAVMPEMGTVGQISVRAAGKVAGPAGVGYDAWAGYQGEVSEGHEFGRGVVVGGTTAAGSWGGSAAGVAIAVAIGGALTIGTGGTILLAVPLAVGLGWAGSQLGTGFGRGLSSALNIK